MGLMQFAKHNGTDEPAHLNILISTLVVCCLNGSTIHQCCIYNRPKQARLSV